MGQDVKLILEKGLPLDVGKNIEGQFKFLKAKYVENIHLRLLYTQF